MNDANPDDKANREQDPTEANPEDNTNKEQDATEVQSEDNVTKDPVMDQIASELVKEMREDGVNKDDKNKPRSSQSTRNTFLDFKPTLRIHLARSTRLPLPLSENNAFCYYVPRTPLCINGL